MNARIFPFSILLLLACDPSSVPCSGTETTSTTGSMGESTGTTDTTSGSGDSGTATDTTDTTSDSGETSSECVSEFFTCRNKFGEPIVCLTCPTATSVPCDCFDHKGAVVSCYAFDAASCG